MKDIKKSQIYIENIKKTRAKKDSSRFLLRTYKSPYLYTNYSKQILTIIKHKKETCSADEKAITPRIQILYVFVLIYTLPATDVV